MITSEDFNEEADEPSPMEVEQSASDQSFLAILNPSPQITFKLNLLLLPDLENNLHYPPDS